MLYRIRGRIVDKSPPYCRLALSLPDGNEVVLELVVPLSAHEQLQEVGQQQELLTLLHVSERGTVLYGFLDEDDRRLFQVLLDLPNVSRGLALRLLSHMRARDLLEAVARGDRSVFERVPGIGKKRAERLVFELQQRLSEFPVTPETPPGPRDLLDRALRALVQLGLRESEARERLDRVRQRIQPSTTLEDLLRWALRES